MVDIVCWCIVVGLLAAWMLTLADKWGIREYAQVHAPCDFLYKLFMCNFCTAWWLNVVICLSLLLITGKWGMLVVPFVSTMITRKYYENR